MQNMSWAVRAVWLCGLAVVMFPSAVRATTTELSGKCPSDQDKLVFKCEGDACELIGFWPKLKGVELTEKFLKNAAGTGPHPTRILAGKQLSIRLCGFNHIRYALAASTEETKVESYVHLAKLWEQVFRLEATKTDRTAGDSLLNWFEALRDQTKALDERLDGATAEVSLKPPDLTKLGTERAESVDGIRKLGLAARAAGEDVVAAAGKLDPERFAIYEDLLERHEALLARLREFEQAASLSLFGRVVPVSTRNAGHYVTVTLTARERSTGTDKETRTVELFVHSRLPLRFHAGFVYSRAAQVQFEKVRTLAGEDLFDRVRNEQSSSSLATFLSYQLPNPFDGTTGTRGRWPLHLSLGTDLSKPGERIYVGATVAAGPFFITGGALSAAADEGRGRVDAAVTAVGTRLETRELFQTFSRRRQWEAFFAVSVNPFR